MMKILNSPVLAMILLVAFFALAVYSTKAKAQMSLNDFVSVKLAEYEKETKAKPVKLWQRDRRQECGDDWLCLVAWAEGK